MGEKEVTVITKRKYLLEDIVGICLYIYIIMITFGEVIARYVFNNSSSWGAETSTYAFIWLTYLTAASLITRREHLYFGVFVDSASPRIKSFFSFISSALFLVLGIIVFVSSMPTIIDDIEYSTEMIGSRLPIVIAHLAIPVGWSAIMIRLLQRLYIDIQGVLMPNNLKG